MNKYLFILKTECKNQLAYIPSYIIKNLFFIVLMLIFYTLWSVVYGSDGFTSNITLVQMIWYLSFTESIELSKSRVFWDVQGEVKGGAIAYTLSRPYSYNLFHLSRAMGTSLIKLIPIFILGFLVSMVLVGPLPGYIKALPFGLILIVLGIVLTNLWNIIVALISFWVEDAFPFIIALQKMIFVIGGMFFPIEFLPSWAQGWAKVLPFTFSAYWPAKVFIDFDFNTFTYVVLGQLFWIGVLIIIATLIFRSAVRRLHVQGG